MNFSLQVFSQDMAYTHKVMDTLCSKTMFGRGYLNDGDKKAAAYICNEFKNIGLSFFYDSCFQKLSYPVNTFPGKAAVSINGQTLELGKDYYVMAKSSYCKGTFDVIYYTVNTLTNPDSLMMFMGSDLSDKFVLVDKSGTKNEDMLKMMDLMSANPKHARGIIHVEEKPCWNVSTKVEKYTVVTISKKAVTQKIKTITVDIENSFIENYPTQNVVAYCKGTEKSDSFFVFTAHYDHLGGYGKDVFIPGANDNAGGISMLLNLAKYYKEHPPKYSVAYIAFTGEEAGLKGSTYFAEHPWFPLEKIKVLLNLDLVGTGDDGAMLVNGAVFKDMYDTFIKINEEKKYLKKIDKRGEAANSDHYPFYAKGVKCFFLYTLGGISEYHNIYDRPTTLPLTKYKEVYHLMINFVNSF